MVTSRQQSGARNPRSQFYAPCTEAFVQDYASIDRGAGHLDQFSPERDLIADELREFAC